MTLEQFYMVHAGHGVTRVRTWTLEVVYACRRHGVEVRVIERFLSPDTLHGSSAQHLRRGGDR